MCRITVEDNGIGFDPRHQERIFGIFQRLHPREVYEGTGIGLAICRKIAEHHGGKITAQGNPDQGSTFEVLLPVVQRGKTGLSDGQTRHHPHGRRRRRRLPAGPRGPASRTAATTTSASSATARSCWTISTAAAPTPTAGAAPVPDLILLDLKMPKKDGREALRELKADAHFKQIPVVVLTTSTDHGRHRSIRIGWE